MSEGYQSAQRINRAFQSVDASQLHAPVHVVHGCTEEPVAAPSYLKSVTYWLIAGVVFCILALAQVLMGDQA